MNGTKTQKNAPPEGTLTAENFGITVLTCFAAIALASLLSAIVAWSLTLAPGVLDDGIQLSGAMFWLRGQTPNVDFYSVYPPLNTYLIGGAFKLLGESIVSYRVVQTLAYLATVAAIAAIALRRIRSFFAPFMLGTLLLTGRLGELQAMTAVMWSSFAIIALFEARSSARRAARAAWLAAAGTALGALALTRPNFAIYVVAAWTIDSALTLGERGQPHVRCIIREGLWTSVPALAVVTTTLLMWGGPPLELLHQVAIVPSNALITYAFSPVTLEVSMGSLRQLAASGLLLVRNRPSAHPCGRNATGDAAVA